MGLSELRGAATRLLDEYTAETGQYAFTTYDHWYGQDGPLTPGDVLMANLLSLRLGWQDVVPLFASGDGEPQALRSKLESALVTLRDARPFEEHDSVTDLEETLAPLAEANVAAEAVPKWTEVTVSKVLHRRRPHIVPLMDSRVRRFYGARKPAAIRSHLWEDLRENNHWLEPLATALRTPDGRPLSMLRTADILIWMAN